MSKTFKSALSTDKELRITGGPERVCFAQRAHNGMESLVFIDNTEAPALALAILEAAGVESPYFNLGDAVDNLRQHVEREAKHTAEAKEHAELEAEALELANAAVIECGNPPYPSVERMDEKVLRRWLAVARRARELNKETPNA